MNKIIQGRIAQYLQTQTKVSAFSGFQSNAGSQRSPGAVTAYGDPALITAPCLTLVKGVLSRIIALVKSYRPGRLPRRSIIQIHHNTADLMGKVRTEHGITGRMGRNKAAPMNINMNRAVLFTILRPVNVQRIAVAIRLAG